MTVAPPLLVCVMITSTQFKSVISASHFLFWLSCGKCRFVEISIVLFYCYFELLNGYVCVEYVVSFFEGIQNGWFVIE